MTGCQTRNEHEKCGPPRLPGGLEAIHETLDPEISDMQKSPAPAVFWRMREQRLSVLGFTVLVFRVFFYNPLNWREMQKFAVCVALSQSRRIAGSSFPRHPRMTAASNKSYPKP